MSELTVYDCGTLPYAPALEVQRRLQHAREVEEIGDTLLLLEHPPVLTMGKSAVREHVLATDKQLAEAGATIEWIERGGETTYHGPGQLVGYVIFNLYDRHRSIKRFVRNMEQVFIDLLGEEYRIEAGRDVEHPGVWVAHEKITAVGISIRNKVTMHGFAFNVAPDLAHFDWIIPCGITDRGQTSLLKLTGRTPHMDEIKEKVADRFTRIYEFDRRSELLPGPPQLSP
ncbi:MAG: lipoyl(octanoyl) transferase LipB [Alkalispirochaetaceae bacterium]